MARELNNIIVVYNCKHTTTATHLQPGDNNNNNNQLWDGKLADYLAFQTAGCSADPTNATPASGAINSSCKLDLRYRLELLLLLALLRLLLLLLLLLCRLHFCRVLQQIN